MLFTTNSSVRGKRANQKGNYAAGQYYDHNPTWKEVRPPLLFVIKYNNQTDNKYIVEYN